VEETEKEKEDRIVAAAEERQRERVSREGFELVFWAPIEADACQQRVHHQISPRKSDYRPCGVKSHIALRMVNPQHPGGMLVPLCRKHLGKLAIELVDMGTAYDDPVT